MLPPLLPDTIQRRSDTTNARTTFSSGDDIGAWARPEGSGFLTGYSPPEEDDGPADPEDFNVDYAIFEERLWPGVNYLVNHPPE